MRSFRPFASLFKASAPEAAVQEGALPDAPAAGQIYSFRTTPLSEFAPPKTGRYAAFKILGADRKYVAMAVLDGIWTAPPGSREAKARSILELHRFSHVERPAVFGINRDWWTPDEDLEDLRFVGVQALSAAERSFADAIARGAVGTCYSTVHAADYSAEGEWRWANDREALVAEGELHQAKEEAERAAREERYRTRLSKLTWEQLLAETPFERWSPSPPFPPEDFTEAARAVIRDACLSLRELGAKPRRAEVRAILKRTVSWFNQADETAGGVIETEEREDICALLEEMAHVARQTLLVDEIDQWREW